MVPLTLGKRICAFKLSRKKKGNLVEIDHRVMLMHLHSSSLLGPHQGKSLQLFLTILKVDCKANKKVSETQIRIKITRNKLLLRELKKFLKVKTAREKQNKMPNQRSKSNKS